MRRRRATGAKKITRRRTATVAFLLTGSYYTFRIQLSNCRLASLHPHYLSLSSSSSSNSSSNVSSSFCERFEITNAVLQSDARGEQCRRKHCYTHCTDDRINCAARTMTLFGSRVSIVKRDTKNNIIPSTTTRNRAIEMYHDSGRSGIFWRDV